MSIQMPGTTENPQSMNNAGTAAAAGATTNSLGSTGTTPTPDAAGAAPLATSGDWVSSLTPDFQNFVKGKGFKEPKDAVESYINLEKLMGAKENLLKLPEKDDAPEWKDIYKRLGKPEKADDYGIKPVEGSDPKFIEWAKNTFHELNLTGKQAESLASKWNEHVNGLTKAQTDTQDAKIAEEVSGLKREWGPAYQQNEEMVNYAATKLELNNEQLGALKNSMGPSGAMKFLHNIAKRIGIESKFRVGDRNNGFNVMTPQQAKARLEDIRKGNDKNFTNKYLAKDAATVKEMENLHIWSGESQ